jgi:hypothetical protein
MGIGDVMHDPTFGEEGIYFFIFSSPITMHSKNFPIKELFNKGLEFMKFLNHFRLKFKQVNSNKFTIIIHKAQIIFVSSNIFECRTPNIRKDEL